MKRQSEQLVPEHVSIHITIWIMLRTYTEVWEVKVYQQYSKVGKSILKPEGQLILWAISVLIYNQKKFWVYVIKQNEELKYNSFRVYLTNVCCYLEN